MCLILLFFRLRSSSWKCSLRCGRWRTIDLLRFRNDGRAQAQRQGRLGQPHLWRLRERYQRGWYIINNIPTGIIG